MERKLGRQRREISWDVFHFTSDAETNWTERGFKDRTVPALYFIQEETATQRVALLPNSTRSQSSLV